MASPPQREQRGLRAFSLADYVASDVVVATGPGEYSLRATVSPQGLQVLAKASILENLSWTPPTLVGTKLFARDRKNIVAFELGL